MKKLIFREFDPVLYPFRLWVVVTDNVDELNGNFVGVVSNKELYLEIPPGNDAVTFLEPMRDIHTRNAGFLIVFESKKIMTAGRISHEATHVSDCIWKYLGEDAKGSEANAYLVSWVVECCEKVKLNKF